MGNTVQGKNIIAYMKVDTTYYPVFCAKTLRFSMEQDELEVTSINSGSSREYIAGMTNATMEVSGVTTSDNTNGRVSITYLQQIIVRRQIQDWKIVMTDDSSNTVNYIFKGLIRTTDFDKVLPGYSTSNVSVRVSGNITIDTIDPPPTPGFDVLADYWIAQAGFSFIDGASSGETDGTNYTLNVDDEIMMVEVEDQNFFLVTGVPTPGEPECRFNTSLATIRFPASLVFSGGERVYVMWKRPI
jgi:predicted secreted protein